MYRIDVEVYHWDNDHFERETRVLRYEDLDDALYAQGFLLTRSYTEDRLVNRNTADIPPGYEERHRFFEELDIWHGAIIESDFEIYTQKVIRTVVE